MSDVKEKAWATYKERTTRYVERADFEAGWNALIEACGGHDHILQIKPSESSLWPYGQWTIQHPVTERLEGSLFDCTLTGLVEIMVKHERFPGPGRYRFTETADGWHWEAE